MPSWATSNPMISSNPSCFLKVPIPNAINIWMWETLRGTHLSHSRNSSVKSLESFSKLHELKVASLLAHPSLMALEHISDVYKTQPCRGQWSSWSNHLLQNKYCISAETAFDNRSNLDSYTTLWVHTEFANQLKPKENFYPNSYLRLMTLPTKQKINGFALDPY